MQATVMVAGFPNPAIVCSAEINLVAIRAPSIRRLTLSTGKISAAKRTAAAAIIATRRIMSNVIHSSARYEQRLIIYENLFVGRASNRKIDIPSSNPVAFD